MTPDPITFLLAVWLAAQPGSVTLAVDDGARAVPIARLVDGQWVGARACVSTVKTVTPRTVTERLTTTGSQPVHAVRQVGPGTAEWLRLAPTILRLFEQREREQSLAVARTTVALRVVDWIFATEGAGGRTYYFEASRRIANTYVDVDVDVDPPGTLRIAVAGFLRDGPGSLTSRGTKSELRWEEDGRPAGPARPDLTPIGVLPRGSGSVWVMKGQSGASTWFSLYEVGEGPARTVLTTRLVEC